jgi:organic radical activating enzyme
MKGWLSEIFCGIQGEGLRLGERMIFVRLAGCDLGCAYCDTPRSRTRRPMFPVYRKSGREYSPNPVEPAAAVDVVSSLQPVGRGTMVSLTGGEPLLQTAFLRELSWRLRRKGFRLYLETNGVVTRGLEEILPLMDVIAMDWKLVSSTRSKDVARSHRRFLLGAQRRLTFVKMVITPRTAATEVELACRTIAAVNPSIPVVLQPVTPHGRGSHPAASLLLRLQELALAVLPDVRIIPQIHPLLHLQ